MKYESKAAVTHMREHNNTMRNLNIYITREQAGELFTTRDLFYFGNELYDHRRWEQAIEKYELFLKRDDGWVEDQIAACGRLADCFQELDRMVEAKQALLKSFMYAAPRAENCCRMSNLYMKDEDYTGAKRW